MSTLIVPNQTAADAIPIGRRIAEIMKAKGNYFTQVQMSARLKIGRETFRLMLKGERDIYTFEMEKIEKDLKVPIPRILQEDICEETQELMHLLTSREDPLRALELAEGLLQNAIGRTESCIAFNRLGWALFELKRYDEAHVEWLKANDLAEEIYETYGETELQYKVLRNLMLSSIEKKDFTRALEMCEKVEGNFTGQPTVQGELYYTRAKIKESLGEIESALELSRKSLHFFIEAKNLIMTGRAFLNVAHFEYKIGNYASAKIHLEKSLEFLQHDPYYSLIATKELVKSLIKLGEVERAELTIRSLLQNEAIHRHTDLVGKLHVLLSRAKNTTEDAEKVVIDQNFSEKVQYLAYKFLCEYYKVADDSEMFMRYYKLAEGYLNISSDVLDEGDM